MKKALGLTVAAFCLWMPLAAQTVTVTSPNGGESWVLGSTHAITWTSTNAGAATVNILLRTSAGQVGVIKSNAALAAGSWSWTSAGQLENGTVVPPGNDYIVGIRIIGPGVFDNSDAAFRLSAATPTPQPSIDVRDQGGFGWKQHDQRAITWHYANAGSATVNITLRHSQSNTDVGVIKTGAPLAAGSWMWSDVGRLENGSRVPDRFDYIFRVSIVGTGLYGDIGLVGITALGGAPSYMVLPLGSGDNYAIGSDQFVSWRVCEHLQGGKVTLWLEKRGGEKHLIAGGIAAADQKYPWKAGQYPGGTAAAGTGYRFRMRVDAGVGPYVFETESADFTLSLPRQVTVKEQLGKPPSFLGQKKPPRLEVTDLGLAPNVDGFGLVFTYKNVGESPLPKASEMPVKPDFRVVYNGRAIASGSLYIPAFAAPPGWEQPGYSGGFIVMPKTYGDFQFYAWDNKLTFVHINENGALGNQPNAFIGSLKEPIFRYCYDLFLEQVQLDWARSDVSYRVSIQGKIPANKESICLDFYGLRKPFRDTITLKPGQKLYVVSRHLRGCEIPADQNAIFLQVTARLLPLESGNERILDADLRNNVLEYHLVRPPK